VAFASLLTLTVRPCEHRTVAVRRCLVVAHIRAADRGARNRDKRSKIPEFVEKPIAERQVCILRVVE